MTGPHRVVLTRRAQAGTVAVFLLPLLLAGIAFPTLLAVEALFDVTSPLPVLVLSAAIQAATVVAVLVHYWWPRHVHLVRNDGRPFQRWGGGGLGVVVLTGGLAAVVMGVTALGYGYVPP